MNQNDKKVLLAKMAAHTGLTATGTKRIFPGDEALTDTGILTIRGDRAKIKYTEHNDGRPYSLKNVKVHLKHINKILLNKKDKKEFEDIFLGGECLMWFGDYLGKCLKVRYVTPSTTERDVTNNELFWLISRGYHTYTLPKENVLIEGEEDE